MFDVSSAKKAIDTKIANMIVMDNLPFSYVEYLGLVRFVKEAVPQYPLHQRKYYRDLICEKMYDAVRIKVEDCIRSHKQSTKISVTIDESSDTESGVSLLSLTSHTISQDSERHSFVQ